jgi:HEAT repeat protein
VKVKLLLSLCVISCWSSNIAATDAPRSEEGYLRRINGSLLIQDYTTACQETTEALSFHKQSRPLLELQVRALSRAGEEQLSLASLKRYREAFSANTEEYKRLLEEVSWGIIHKAANCQSPLLRVMGILASFLSQDAKGIEIIKERLRDPCIQVRAVAVKLCANLHDAILEDEIVRLAVQEKAWRVRVEAIKAAGAMKLVSLRPFLISLASSSTCHPQEKVAAISALVQMQKKISRKELTKLVHSDRAGIRILACEIAAHLELNGDADVLLPLLNDHSSEVRTQVLHTIGLLRVPINLEKGMVVDLMNDLDPLVSITAAWVVSLADPARGQKVLAKYLRHEEFKVQRVAAAALVAAGRYGFPLTMQAFEETDDPYVRLNLALGLIGQRVNTDVAADAIFNALNQLPEQWMEDEEGVFSYIAPSHVRHDEIIPNAPEAVNQKTRLEMLNILAALKYPRAQEAVNQFLKEKQWGITGMAAAVLLTEGDDEAIEIVKLLLNDQNDDLRLQAAFVIALWGGGEEALNILEQAYSSSSFENKEKIIEAIGRVGAARSVPFLVDRLQESHQSLRVIAAASLLMVLYK